MAGETAKDLVVRLAFEHGDTKAQISAIKNELKLLDAGFAESAAMAAGFSGGLNSAGAQADMLKQKISLQEQVVQKYGAAIDKAKEKLQKSTDAYEKHGQRLEELKAREEQLKTEKEQLAAAMAKEKAASGDNTEAYIQMSYRMDELNAAIKETSGEIDREEAALARSDKAINRNEQALQKLEIAESQARTELSNLRGQLESAESAIDRHADAWRSAAEQARGYADAAKGAGEWQTSAGKTLSKGSAAIVALGTAAATAAIDWESSFAGVRKTVNGTEEQLRGLEAAILDMPVPTDYGELADIAANAGQLGVATENVATFTRVMADLAETTDLTADSAASSFAQYANITGMAQGNFDRLGSVTVELGNNLATTESKIVGMATRIAAAGKQAGLTDQQIFGLAGGLSSLGLEAEAGGTAFSKALSQMQVAVETGSDRVADFARVAGMSADEFAAAFRDNAAGAFIQFVQGLSSGSDSALVMLDEMGITEVRLRDTLLRASNASDLLTRSVNMANSAWEENSALTNEASVRYNTTASRMKMVGKQAQRTAMDFGQAILPYLEKGLNGVQSVIDRFQALDDAQRDNIVRWGAYAAAIGPALTMIGKANTGIGNMAGKFAEFATGMAEGSTTFMSALGGLLGPAGIAAVTVGIGVATAKLIEYATGAKAAREAMEQLKQTGQDWINTQAQTIYDTGTGDPLARFGLSREQFSKTVKESKTWMDELIATWTDGKAETRQTVKQFADGFKEQSDEVRQAIQERQELLEGYGALTPQARAQMTADLEQLAAYDEEVEQLLTKRRNGTLTEEDQQRLNSILQARQQIEIKYSLDSKSGYDQIITQMRAAVERAQAAGGEDASVYGDALNALAEGRRAYAEALNDSYDAEYAQIQLIEDEAARQAALAALNEQYNERRREGEEAYAEAVRDAASEALKAGDYDETLTQIDNLVAELSSLDGVDVSKIKNITEGMDEGKLASMIALIEQLKSAGMSDDDLKALGIDYGDILAKINAIRDAAGEIDGLDGLADMFGTALPEEIQRLMIGLDMTQAAADWEAFAEGKSIVPEIEPPETELTVEAVANFVGYSAPEGEKPTVEALAEFTGYKAQSGETPTLEAVAAFAGYTPPTTTISLPASVRLNPLDAAAITAWQAANSGVALEGPPAKVSVTLGADWKDDLQTALDNGMLEVYDSDGMKIDVTPNVVDKLTANDIAAVDEDGTVHVIVTASVGTPEGVEQSTKKMNQTPVDGTVFEGMATSAQTVVDRVNAANAELETLRATMDGMEPGDVDDMGRSFGELETQAQGATQMIAEQLGQLSDADLESIGGQILNLIAALESGEGTEEQIAAWQSELESLLNFVGTISPDAMTSTGTNIMAGIAAGMQAYGWTGDASTVASALEAAINGAMGVASPSRRMMPTGEYISAGIGKGMAAYGFGGDAGQVSAAIVAAFAGLPAQGQSIGSNFGAGLERGLNARLPGIVSKAKAAANQIASAFRQAWDIHSPSKVAEGLTEMFGKGLERGMDDWPTVSERVLDKDVARLRRGMGAVITNTTDSRDMSTSNAITIERMEVRDQGDIEAVSRDLYNLTRRDQRMVGA